MQTFLPYPDFAASARCLDRQRLGKQRSECLTLVKALMNGGAWSNHPAARMWRGHGGCLLLYGLKVCAEWINRGYRDTCHEKMCDLLAHFSSGEALSNPDWLGDPTFHASHRSNLLRKDPEWYGQFGWTECDLLPYVWPV